MHPRTYVAAALCAYPSTILAQRSAWLTRLGHDTVAIERAERKGNHISGRYAQTVPRVQVIDFALDLDKSGRVSHYQMLVYDTTTTAAHTPRVTLNVSFASNDIVAVMTREGKTDTTHVPAGPIPVPYVLNNWTLMEQLTRERARARSAILWFAGYTRGEKGLQPAVARWVGSDSISVDFSPAVLMLRADRSDKLGRLQGADGRRTTIKVVPERLADIDVDGLAQKFLARQRAAASASRFLSPRDTARATIAGASLLIDYGRPSRRGRVVWGGLVPYGEVWRTGANAATQFTTDRTLKFANGAEVPPGQYTLWTIPAADGATLVVNRQVHQWGTVYDPGKDLVRIPVAIAELPGTSLERFTITIEPDALGGVMYFAWDTRRIAASFQVI